MNSDIALRARLLATALTIAMIGGSADAATTGPVPPLAAAYPPSCLAPPLNDTPSGPAFSHSVTLATLDLDTMEYRGFEPVDFTFWRVACVGGRSALLLRIARATNAPASTAAQFPFQYGLLATQGNYTATLRLAQEPNTTMSSVQPGSLVVASMTLVVENVLRDASTQQGVPPGLPAGIGPTHFDFNQALRVTLPDPTSAGITPRPAAIVLDLPAYDRSLYPAAAGAMPISGYNAGNYFDGAHNGEGLLLEIGDDGQTSGAQRYLSAAWFTYDRNGSPFWIFGTARFAPGATFVDVPLASFAAGGFAGAFGSSAAMSPWGSMRVSFPDCDSVYFSYAAGASVQAPVPVGAGERVWTRLTQSNGLSCK
ncbi:MAG TPA: hypothetical protein VMV45_19975 [Casimicrobiaceae bacterium]|nr:hypothetical protein [Casimicrobiaceae bacterium]